MPFWSTSAPPSKKIKMLLSLDNAVASDKKASTTRQLELHLSIGARDVNEQLSEITAEQPAMPDIKAKSVSHMSVYRAKAKTRTEALEKIKSSERHRPCSAVD